MKINKLKLILTSLLFVFAINTNVSAKTFKIAFDADPVTLDIHQQLSGAMLQQSHLLFDPLIRFTRDNSLEPRLATKWERLDNKTIRFFLRKGVKFHSGNTFNAKDVVYTVKRLKSSSEFKAIFEPVKKVKVIDDYTIDLVTAENFPLTLNVATYLFPMDRDFYKGKDDISKTEATFASTNASGTGPFIVTERQQGVKTIYKRFDNYWDKNTGNISEMILTPISDGATRTSALLSGGVDFISPVPSTDVQRIKNNSATDLLTLDGTRIIMFQMNQDQVPAFKDKRVRQAIAYAINNEAIVKKIMKGFGTTAAQMSPASYAGHVKSLKPRYDIKKAKALLKEAGYEKGFTISMLAPNNRYVNDQKIAEAVANMLAKINIKVDLKTLPKAQYWPEFDNRSANMLMIGWHSDTEDSANFSEFLTMCPNKDKGFGQYNSGNYCNSELDATIIKANKEVDLDKRTKLLEKAEKIMYDDAAFIPLHWQDLSWGVKKGVDMSKVINVMNFTYFGDIVLK